MIRGHFVMNMSMSRSIFVNFPSNFHNVREICDFVLFFDIGTDGLLICPDKPYNMDMDIVIIE